MSNIILVDDPEARLRFMPLTFTRPIAELRVGILTIRRKWELRVPGTYSYRTVPYLAVKYPEHSAGDDDVLIAGNTVPDPQAPGGARALECITDIFSQNAREIEADFNILTRGRESQPLPASCTLIGPAENLFIEEGARLQCAVLNVTGGPIYIGAGAEIMEGSCLRGPVAVCEHATVNMGTKIYPATTIGPWCKVGGELNNVVMTGYSNKAHDGFLGNAVIGEWCNLGAGCVSSNLKNDYSLIKRWDYSSGSFMRTGLQFCGLLMGDHSKAGINTMFNTATTVGVGCNIHGAGFPRTFIESFSQGGALGFKRVPLKAMLETASRVMARRHVELTDADVAVITHLYDTEEVM